MKKGLHILLFAVFVLTVMVPLTGIHVHKLSSLLFLVLCIVHAGMCRKKMNVRRFLMAGLIFTAFLTGLLGMIFEEYPFVMSVHKVSSIGIVFFVAIHIFVFKSKILPKRQARGEAY